MSEPDRIRWHCRRGMLELDLLLERFSREHLPRLSAGQTAQFVQLLALPDHELLELLMEHESPAGLLGAAGMPQTTD